MKIRKVYIYQKENLEKWQTQNRMNASQSS